MLENIKMVVNWIKNDTYLGDNYFHQRNYRVPVKNLKSWLPGRTITPDGLQVSVSNSERSVSKVRNQKLALSGIYGTCDTICLCKICSILLFDNVLQKSWFYKSANPFFSKSSINFSRTQNWFLKKKEKCTDLERRLMSSLSVLSLADRSICNVLLASCHAS